MSKKRKLVGTEALAADWQVDCRNMPPPFPLLGARAAVDRMSEGEVLLVLATDPEAEADVPAWCRMTGNPLIHRRREKEVFGFWIRKGRRRA